MRKVLIVTDLYYESPRIPGLCKYITQFGWKATQLEQKFPSTSEPFMKSLLFRYIILSGTLFAYPDEIRSRKASAIQSGKELLAKEKSAARQPILATDGTINKQLQSIFESTQVGHYAIGVDDIKKILYEYYSEYLENSAGPSCDISKQMDKYLHYEMAQKFSHALSMISQQKPSQTLRE